MRNNLIVLVKNEVTKDKIGQRIKGPTIRTHVYADRRSISQSEFMDAGLNDLKPEVRFDVFTFEYNGELTVEEGDKVYSVYRTYEAGDKTELYCEARKGDEK